MTTLYEALFGPYKPRCVALVGAGGKTTALRTLASELAAAGERVVVTTTTKMRPPGAGEPFAQSAGEAARLLGGHARIVAGLPAPDGRKMTGLPEGELGKLLETGAFVLVEADGARGLPLKMTAAYEPVIPPEAEAVVAVAGLDAPGRPLGTVCHRWELALPVLGGAADTPVAPAAVARLLKHCYLNAYPDKTFSVLLNKADDAARLAVAAEIDALLPGVRCVAACLSGDKRCRVLPIAPL